MEASAAGRAGPAADHACLTFGEAGEMLDLTAAYVRDGLAAGERVIWVSGASPRLAARQLEARGVPACQALAAGQLTACRPAGRLVSGQAFRARAALRWLARQPALARQDGFGGLRVALDMSWALRPVTGADELPRFEEGVGRALAGAPAAVRLEVSGER